MENYREPILLCPESSSSAPCTRPSLSKKQVFSPPPQLFLLAWALWALFSPVASPWVQLVFLSMSHNVARFVFGGAVDDLWPCRFPSASAPIRISWASNLRAVKKRTVHVRGKEACKKELSSGIMHHSREHYQEVSDLFR